MEYRRCYAVISLKDLRNNLLAIRKAAGTKSSLLTVVKANAYGHGSVQVAAAVSDITDLYGVACITEAMELREAGIEQPILVLGYTSPSQYREMIENGISAALYNYEEAKILSSEAAILDKTASVHIAADTGMTRIGFRSAKESIDLIEKISLLPYISIDGIFTHMSCADMFDNDSRNYTKMQQEEFRFLTESLKMRGLDIPLVHICNSAGILRFQDAGYTCVRSGLITYGMYPAPELKEIFPGLKPILSWYAHVIHIAEVESGRGVSYGATYHTEKPLTRIATISAGYADGYPRSLSNRGRVIINGHYAPIIGRVCMDQFMVDITDIADVKVEDLAILIGSEGDSCISADEIAELDGTINYEVTCRISPRVDRIYLD